MSIIRRPQPMCLRSVGLQHEFATDKPIGVFLADPHYRSPCVPVQAIQQIQQQTQSFGDFGGWADPPNKMLRIGAGYPTQKIGNNG